MRASRVVVAALLAAGAAAGAEEGAARVVLRWSPIVGAAGYDLQVARDAAFTAFVLELRVELAGHRLGSPPEEGRLFWRVRSVDADGRPGPWSAAKILEPLARPLAAAPEPEPETLDVPPLPPEALPEVRELAPQPPASTAPFTALAARGEEEREPSALVPDWSIEGGTALGKLQSLRPGASIAWRANLLGVDAPEIAGEVALPLPWPGAHWWSALRAGWWRVRVTVPASVGLSAPRSATADVVPLSLLLLRSFPAGWGRLYAGGGAGAHLAVIGFRGAGALEVSGSLVAAAGAGRSAGPGELFGELTAGFGGVDGPLGRLRTGGISLAVGYRLAR